MGQGERRVPETREAPARRSGEAWPLAAPGGTRARADPRDRGRGGPAGLDSRPAPVAPPRDDGIPAAGRSARVLLAGRRGTRRRTRYGVAAWSGPGGGGTRRPAVDRLFLICVSCLFSLVVLEIGSAACRAWMHRFPVLPTTFPPSAPEEYRILVLGGSSAWASPTGPGSRWARSWPGSSRRRCPRAGSCLEILAWLGAFAGAAASQAGAITRRPDAMIIYSGHNEFAARFEENRASTLAEEPRLRLLQRGLPRQPSLAVLPPGLRDRQQEPAGQPAAPERPAPAHRPSAVQPLGVGRGPGGLLGPAGDPGRLLRANGHLADLDHPAGQRGRLRAEPLHGAGRDHLRRSGTGWSGSSKRQGRPRPLAPN